MLQLLKNNGCLSYDLGGIDPKENPGGYHFKAGLAGKNGKDVRHIGEYEACVSPVSSYIINIGERARKYL